MYFIIFIDKYTYSMVNVARYSVYRPVYLNAVLKRIRTVFSVEIQQTL
jgi:hypothetical protein